MKGPAGFGRYSDDPDWIGCPWAKSSESPCLARDGKLALSSGREQVCVGCGHKPGFLLADLRDDGGVKIGNPPHNPVAAADYFHGLVEQATKPLAEMTAAPGRDASDGS